MERAPCVECERRERDTTVAIACKTLFDCRDASLSMLQDHQHHLTDRSCCCSLRKSMKNRGSRTRQKLRTSSIRVLNNLDSKRRSSNCSWKRNCRIENIGLSRETEERILLFLFQAGFRGLEKEFSNAQ